MGRLRPVRKGVYALGRFDRRTTAKAILAVHPYYGWVYRPDEHAEFPSRYMHRFDLLAKTHEGPLITLEDAVYMDETVARYRRLGRTQDRYLIPTEPGDPKPAEMGWWELIRFLKGFKGKPIGLAGGYSWKEEHVNGIWRGGCLGKVKMMLENSDVDFELMEKLVYS